MEIRPIPTTETAIPLQGEPWPFPGEGVRFQMSGPPPGMVSIFKPSDSMVLDEQNRLYIAFSRLNTIIRIAGAEDPTQFFGPEYYGGHNETLVQPTDLFLYGNTFWSVCGPRGQIALYDPETMAFQDLIQASGPDPVINAQGQYYLTHKDYPDRVIRLEANGGGVLRFDLPGEQKVPDSNLFIIPRNDGGLVGIRRGVTRIIHVEPNGLISSQTKLTPGAELHAKFTVADALLEGDKVWLLLQANQENEAGRLLVINQQGKLLYNWTTPFRADQLALGSKYIALGYGPEGKAQTFNRTKPSK